MDDNIGYDGWIGTVEIGDWYCLCGPLPFLPIVIDLLWWVRR